MISIQITGVQGAGKTTVVNELHSLLPQVVFKDYADFMLAVLGYGDKDTIGKLTEKERSCLYKPASLMLYSFVRKENYAALVLESHVSVELPDHTFMVFGPSGFRECNTKLIIIIEADSKEIYYRRMNDVHRQREIGTVASIETHQKLNRKQSEVIARELGIPFEVIANDNLKECVNAVYNIINQTLSKT